MFKKNKIKNTPVSVTNKDNEIVFGILDKVGGGMWCCNGKSKQCGLNRVNPVREDMNQVR